MLTEEQQEFYLEFQDELASLTWFILAASKKYKTTPNGTFAPNYFRDARIIINKLKKIIPQIPYPIAKYIYTEIQ
jgi:hypothetical protein